MAEYFDEIARRGRELRQGCMTAAQSLRLQRELADLAHDPSDMQRDRCIGMLEQHESQLEIARTLEQAQASAAARRLARSRVEGLLAEAEDFMAGLNIACSNARYLRHVREDVGGRARTKELRESAWLVLERIRQNITTGRARS